MATGDDCRVRVTGDPGQEKSVVLRVADLPANVKRAVCVAMRDNETSDTPALGGVMDIVENLMQAAQELVTEGNNDVPSLTDIYDGFLQLHVEGGDTAAVKRDAEAALLAHFKSPLYLVEKPFFQAAGVDGEEDDGIVRLCPMILQSAQRVREVIAQV